MMQWSCRACRQNQSAIGDRREHRNTAFDLFGISQIDWGYVHTLRLCNRLNHGELPDPIGDGGIA
jgi:hypothetical protein